MAIVSERPAPIGKAVAPDHEYQVLFRRVSDGREVAGGIISRPALQPLLHQALFEALREGTVDEQADTDCTTAEPIFAVAGDEPGQVSGLRVIVKGREKRFERSFGLEVFEAAAQFDFARIAKSGQFGDDRKAVFRVVARPAEGPAALSDGGAALAKVRRKPVTLLEGQLDDWLRHAEPFPSHVAGDQIEAKDQGAIGDIDYPLFLTRPALERAREYCFKPDRNEGAAMLMGHLYRQRLPGPEIFGVADTALELRHARHERFALTPTPETLADLTRQWKLRQTRLGRPHEVPLLLAHSHDFLPSLAEDGQANCPSCPLRPTCQLVSSFYSAGDVQFHTGLFSKQPWVAGLVFGRTPRDENALRLFVLDGGRARERGYYLIDAVPAGALFEEEQR